MKTEEQEKEKCFILLEEHQLPSYILPLTYFSFLVCLEENHDLIRNWKIISLKTNQNSYLSTLAIRWQTTRSTP